MFAPRTPPPEALAINRLQSLREARERAGLALFDLTVSNPTAVGLRNPAWPAALAELCATSDALQRYAPAPLGLWAVRDAIATASCRPGAPLAAEQVVLTASTSEAYAFACKLLCAPGDAMLIPAPSYPLFEPLLALEAVDAPCYPLCFAGDWQIDLGALSARISARTRAIVAVHPNNPTGHYLTRHEAEALAGLCRAHDLALIVDEVFAAYPHDAPKAAAPSPLAGWLDAPLVISLDGMSKRAGLPQLKLAWMLLGGDADRVAEALARLEFIADAFLSVSAAAQLVAPALLADRRGPDAIAARITATRAQLLAAVPSTAAWSVLPTEGGWYAVLRLPACCDELCVAEALVERHGVCVHPGRFFGFAPRSAHLVVSLLCEGDALRAGLHAIDAEVARALAGDPA